MANNFLKAVKDGQAVAVGDDKSVTITGEPADRDEKNETNQGV